MNIAFFTNNYDPIKSGITVSIKSYSKYLRQCGHRVYIFAPSFPNHLDIENDIIRTTSLKLYYKEKYPISLATTDSLKKSLEDLNIDIVHSHHPFGIGPPALRAAQALKLPVVFTYHTLYEHYTHYLPLPDIECIRNSVKKMAIAYANKCDVVIAPTYAVKKMLGLSGCRTTIKVLPTGISEDLKIDISKPELKELLNIYGIQSNSPIVLCVSRLAKEKNLSFLLKVFAKVIINLPHCKLLMVGDGPFMSALKKEIKGLNIEKNIIFTGYLDHFELAKHYSISDVLIHASISETQGLPLTEALYFGLPIIATDSPVNRELVTDLKAGYVSPKNMQSFAENVVKRINDKHWINECYDNNRKNSEMYEYIKLVDELETIYDGARDQSYNGVRGEVCYEF